MRFEILPCLKIVTFLISLNWYMFNTNCHKLQMVSKSRLKTHSLVDTFSLKHLMKYEH